MNKNTIISRRDAILGSISSLGFLIGQNVLGEEEKPKITISSSITPNPAKPISFDFDTYFFSQAWLYDYPEFAKSGEFAQEPHKNLLSKGVNNYVLFDFKTEDPNSERLTRVNISRNGNSLGENLKKQDMPLVLKRTAGKVKYKVSTISPQFGLKEHELELYFLDNQGIFNRALVMDNPKPNSDFSVFRKYYQGEFPRALAIYNVHGLARLNYHVYGLERVLGVKTDSLEKFWKTKDLFNNDYASFLKYYQEHQTAPVKINPEIK